MKPDFIPEKWWAPIKTGVAFFLIMTLLFVVVFQVNDYRIEGVYHGEDREGNEIIGNAHVSMPVDIPEEYENMYVIFTAKGIFYRVRPIPRGDLFNPDNLSVPR